jgi:NTE family protein
MTKTTPKKNIALVLSSGGARGFAHIGVIDELNSRGYKITSVAGSSMGALVGGLYVTGNLDKFREWVVNLDKLSVFRMLDFTISSQGFIRGERVFEKMRKLEMIPAEVNIEDFSIKYVAVATDILNNQEVLFNRGNLYKAIRASISIPNVFTPIENNEGLLVDGGVLNPIPINRIPRTDNDLLIAVDVNSLTTYPKPYLPQRTKNAETVHSERVTKLIQKWDELISRHHDTGDTPIKKKEKLGYFDILARSIQLMQSQLSQQTITTYPPDVLVNISKDSCSVYEFYKGKEMIAYGRKACKLALDKAGL